MLTGKSFGIQTLLTSLTLPLQLRDEVTPMYLIDKKLSLYDACAAYLGSLIATAIAEAGEHAGSANAPSFNPVVEPIDGDRYE